MSVLRKRTNEKIPALLSGVFFSFAKERGVLFFERKARKEAGGVAARGRGGRAFY